MFGLSWSECLRFYCKYDEKTKKENLYSSATADIIEFCTHIYEHANKYRSHFD